MLLRYMHWNKEKLIEKYMDNSTEVLIAAGAIPPAKPAETCRSQSSSIRQTLKGTRRQNRRAPTGDSSKSGKNKILERATPPVEENKPFLCPICFDDSQTETLELACEHKFCKECWSAYVASKVRTEAECAVACMAEGCAVIAPDSFVRTALGEDTAMWERFQELIVRHFVTYMSNLKFCPYPSCTHTVSCPVGASRAALSTIVPVVTCGASSTHTFCFGCAVDSDHRPVICAVAKMWLQKCRDDSETANWIKSNTKECSKCQSTIEKNGGCK